MKLVTAERGRFIVIFPTEELRPPQGVVIRSLVSEIRARYDFAKSPNPIDPDPANALVFKNGLFRYQDDVVEVVELSIFPEGIVAEARTTDIARAVFADLIAWAMKAFNLNSASSEPKMHYGSHIIVEFDRDVDFLISGFAGIVKTIHDAAAGICDIQSDLRVTRLWLGSDPKSLLESAFATDFVIERRAGAAFALNRFFCSAPLPTDVHFKLLEQIETTLRVQ